MRIGALEAGGTKMVCAIGDETGTIFERTSFPTKTPQETMPQMIAWFAERKIEALGIGCFGPIDLDKTSKTYGYITSTPKLAWQNFDIVGTFRKALARDGLDLTVAFDTDVNASCLGEATWGNAKDVDSAIYITIGTGIGVGVLADGALLHGLHHPEGGHILLARKVGDDYKGKCPYHKEPIFCLEGMAAGPAIEERWGKAGKDLANEAAVWELEAHYIATALVNFIMTLSPKRIILGGGVMKQEQMLPLIHQKTVALINGYVEIPNPKEYIVLPALGDDQGIKGCIKLALNA